MAMNHDKLNNHILDVFESYGVVITPEQRARFKSGMEALASYQPVVGILGKTGVGKSSLCNALFGQDVCEVSDVEACTRQQQEVDLNTGGRGIRLLDVPGVGESRERDDEYRQLYSELLPKVDALFWVLKGDDRAFATDENFYAHIVKPYIDKGKPFFVVLNQVDKIEPFREWDEERHCPGLKQAANIEAKRRYVSDRFGLPLSQVLAVSANERYCLSDLVDELIHALPNEQKLIVLDKVEQEHRTETAKAEAERGWVNVAWEKVKEVVSTVVGVVVEKVVDAVVDKVFSPLRKLASLFW